MDTLQVPDLEMEELETPSGETSGDTQSSETQSQADGERKPPQVPDVDSSTESQYAQLTQALVENGIATKAQLDQLFTATRQHAGMLNLLQNDTRGFLLKLGEYYPQLRKQLTNVASDLWLEENEPGDESDEGQGRGGRSRASTSGPSPEVVALNQRLQRLEAAEAGKQAAATYDNLRQAFNGRIDQYLGMKELEDLTGRDKKAVKALLLQSLAEDGTANARIQTGNFRDIPTHLNRVLKDWTADVVKSSEDEADSRANVQRNGVKTTASTGAQNTGGLSENDMSRVPGGGDIWEEAVQEFGRDLNAAKAKAAKRR